MRNILLLVVCIVFGAAGTALAVEPQQPEAQPEAVCGSTISVKCTRCHSKTRICNALGTKSDRRWYKTISLMVSRGAELTKKEQNKVVACLSSLPQGSQVVCD